MNGTLTVIGVGPGDPELLTLKALRMLNDAQVICVPKGREEGSSLALSIAEKAVELKGKEIIEAHFPMVKTKRQGKGTVTSGDSPGRGTGHQNEEARRSLPPDDLESKWNSAVEAISDRLRKGIDVAFITLGDPTIYSTFYYLYDKLIEHIPDLKIEVVPGVSSINASAALAGISLGLGDDRIAILPANYMEHLGPALEAFDTVVLMKVSKVFAEVRSLLGKMGLISRAVYVSRAGMNDERVYRDISEVRDEDVSYFSMVIVRK